MVRHNIILSGVLSSQECVLGVRLGEKDECGSMTVKDLAQLLFDDIEGCWWLCMCYLVAVWVVIVMMILLHGEVWSEVELIKNYLLEYQDIVGNIWTRHLTTIYYFDVLGVEFISYVWGSYGFVRRF